MAPRRLIPVLPTALTLANLVCGFIAMAKTVDALQFAAKEAGPLDQAFANRIVAACWYVMAAMVFDALDGRVARLMNQASPFGVQLDSLADVVTFGLAPALMAKAAYEHTIREMGLVWHPGVVTLLCSLYLMGAALRLARFNTQTDTDETSHLIFVGLPSPAAAATVATTLFFVFTGRTEVGLSAETADRLGVLLLRALPGIAAALGLLMISKVRYVHFANRYVKSRARFTTLVKLAVIGWLVVVFHEWLLFAGSVAYVIGGAVLWLVARARGHSPVDELPAPWDPEDEEEEPAT
jgi:CDP-diacylglycerol--serine O-phosphatidyltransferase